MSYWLFGDSFTSMFLRIFGDSVAENTLVYALEACLWSVLDFVTVLVFLLIPFSIVFKIIRNILGGV